MLRRDVLFGAGGAVLLGGIGTYGWRSSTGSMADYAEYVRHLRAPLDVHRHDRELIRFATLAASGHNTQPWKFVIRPGAIDILPDLARTTRVVDPDDHHLFVSLGCAAENLAIAAAATGRPGEAQADAEGRVQFRHSPGAPHADPLFAAIPRRQSTRADYDGRPVPARDLEALRKAAAVPGVRLVLLTERRRIDPVRDLIVAGNDGQMRDAAFRAELKDWVRFNPRSAAKKGDGLFTAASGNPVMPDILGHMAFDMFVTAEGENDRYARQIDSSAGIAVFLAEHEDKAHWVAVGRACQRCALAATALGLKQAFVNQPVEVARLRPALASLVGEAGLRPDIVMRFGYGPALPYSPRRPVEDVLA
ncbi:Acg family FMN-binding oxidoreductase [Sphingobium lignivorans]|uniref:Nitroreductase n=1 Tax=Sphingobium lignivorans TaxID=2735886 RepID=A0ABR6NF49_9SPHN|nr:nitroreductase family protein [Sphingobium lignivorans]MBB5985908.1 nitroreductase [Sphingobium lignivorans]